MLHVNLSLTLLLFIRLLMLLQTLQQILILILQEHMVYSVIRRHCGRMDDPPPTSHGMNHLLYCIL
jgi:hypothetical protein